MVAPFVFSGSDPSDRAVTFSSLDQPHGDALTWVQVRLDGEGLTAACSAELLDGDEGLDVDSEKPTNGGTATEALRLSHLLIQLGSGPLWDGSRRWRSLGGRTHRRASSGPDGARRCRLRSSPMALGIDVDCVDAASLHIGRSHYGWQGAGAMGRRSGAGLIAPARPDRDGVPLTAGLSTALWPR